MPKSCVTVDDSKTIRDMVGFTLKNAGYEVAEASDGNAGLGWPASASSRASSPT